jgi:hypothetical protein
MLRKIQTSAVGFVCGVLVLCALVRVAGAQATNVVPGGISDVTAASFDAAAAVQPISGVEGAGVKVGEGTVLHPTFGAETGYVSNVFYSPTNPQGAGVLRAMAQIAMASLSTDRLNPSEVTDDATNPDAASIGMFQYRLNAAIAYDQMLSSNSAIENTGGFSANALFHGLVNPQGTFSLGFLENFTRTIRASNFETNQNLNRDVNVADLFLNIHPYGSALSGYAYAINTIDIFESTGTQQYPNRTINLFGAHPQYRLFPRTSIYIDASLGYSTGIGSSVADTSHPTATPFAIRAGIASLLTLKISANASIGYTNGFYSSGPSYSAPNADVYVEYRYDVYGKIGAWYDLSYSDSINANFYEDNSFRFYWEHLFSPVAFLIEPELHFRHYDGTTITGIGGATTRDDTVFAILAGVHYNFRNWIAATVDFRFETLSTGFRYMSGPDVIDPEFTRFELLGGLRLAL